MPRWVTVRLSRWGLVRWGLGLLGLGLTLLLSMVSCQAPPPQPVAPGAYQVVATSTILADWVSQIAGSTIQLNSILQPGDDPHVYEPRPADSRLLEEADLIFYNGYNLEPGLIRLMESNSRATKVAVGEIIPPLQLAKPHQSPQAPQTVPDPHVWGDAENAVKMVGFIQKQLEQSLGTSPQASNPQATNPQATNPQATALLQQNAAKLVAELTQLDRWIQAQIATIPAAQRQLITTHDAFQYYAQAYGLKVMGTLIGISTEEQPSAQTTRNLVEAVKAAQVPAIFAETTINPNLIRTVAEEAGVRLAERPLYSDSVGAVGSGAETYVKMMVANTETITTALGGKVTPFKPTGI
jgi:manganese/iron transport system substrate-binding protein